MKLKVGDIAQIRFLDHCHGQGVDHTDPLEFHVYGEVIGNCKDHYVIASWLQTNGALDQNTETFTILKSAILKSRRLK